MRSQGHGAPAPQPVGASGQLGQEQTLPRAEDLLSRYGVGLGRSGGAPHGGTRLVSAHLPQVFSRQDCGSTETISEAPGAYGSRSRSNAARSVTYETASALASRSSPEVGVVERHVPGQSDPALSPNLLPMVGSCVSSGRSALSQGFQACCGFYRCFCHGVGGHVQRACSLGSVDGAPAALAHQLPRVASSTLSLVSPQGASQTQARTGPYGQHCDRCVYQPTRWSTLPSYVATRLPPPPMESEASEVASRHSCSRGAQPCGRLAFTAASPAGRMATPSPGGSADLECLWSRTGRPVCLSRHDPLPVVLLPVRGDPRHGRPGSQLAPGPAQVCVSPSEPSCTDSVQGQGG